MNCVAGHSADKPRHFDAAPVESERTTRVERVPLRRIDGVGNFPSDFAVRAISHRDVRYGVEQHARIRMTGRAKERSGVVDFQTYPTYMTPMRFATWRTTVNLWLMKRYVSSNRSC